ncbi:NmrA family NAD(P)-binding protein [Flammeovirga sp. EKP202]|uniref:NmrA family NAD(P)-binding protein n=1 Tax=Flammeovirga sp. EKP202 TaxID=2770592 RepID=UPI00165F174E|nr:NmrA family NAD(P)-binding protein [Flammeovirga sp. EKP202]MBD0402544.1 NmrA family NAD(P)-binding protein [Flammeovirga sp. EKP202]
MKKKVLLTGLNSIIGKEVFRYLSRHTQTKIIVGQRHNPNLPQQEAEYRYLDFNDNSTFQEALIDIDTVFLIIPRNVPHFEHSYRTFLASCKSSGVSEVIFSSVYRGRYSFILPHHKVEKIIRKSGMDYIIVQATYFMQNLTTFFKKEIQEDQKIAIPHLSKKFNWIDARNAGDAIVNLIYKFDEYKNQTIPLMGNENKNFMEVTAKLTASLPKDVVYNSTLIEFILSLKRKGLQYREISILLVFMFLENLDNRQEIYPNYEKITGKKPTRLIEFIMRHIPDLLPANNA